MAMNSANPWKQQSWKGLHHYGIPEEDYWTYFSLRVKIPSLSRGRGIFFFADTLLRLTPNVKAPGLFCRFARFPVDLLHIRQQYSQDIILAGLIFNILIPNALPSSQYSGFAPQRAGPVKSVTLIFSLPCSFRIAPLTFY